MNETLEQWLKDNLSDHSNTRFGLDFSIDSTTGVGNITIYPIQTDINNTKAFTIDGNELIPNE